MQYSMQINGIHCSGCISLIKISLEELGFEQVEVSTQGNISSFTTNIPESQIKSVLDQIFETELQQYNYFNLNKVN